MQEKDDDGGVIFQNLGHILDDLTGGVPKRLGLRDRVRRSVPTPPFGERDVEPLRRRITVVEEHLAEDRKRLSYHTDPPTIPTGADPGPFKVTAEAAHMLRQHIDAGEFEIAMLQRLLRCHEADKANGSHVAPLPNERGGELDRRRAEASSMFQEVTAALAVA